VAFQVLRGGDGQAGFAVRHPNGNIVHPYAWKAQSDYQETSSAGGYYGVCVDNQFSRFASKLVNLYITTFRFIKYFTSFTSFCEMVFKLIINEFTDMTNGKNIRKNLKP